ncbi:MAG: methyl-accepting chemotaxis protein [Candidatus Eremiobacteraeota bacterium]|nr:methyl-accepting chemotaxis protein [Candidatus Eremiobacteraeota bacterium]
MCRPRVPRDVFSRTEGRPTQFLDRSTAPDAPSDGVAAWLRTIGERRNLTIPPPFGTVEAAAAALSAFSAEFADYAALIEDARQAVRRNGEQLAGAVGSAARQDELIRDTAAAVGEVSAEAAQMAATVDLLQRHVADASHAGVEASSELRIVSEALSELHRGLVASAQPLERIGESVTSLGEMLHALGKLAARAQLLAVNAAIEAAHINSESTRFDIVASEVRALSVSTRDAAAEVRRIAVDLRSAAQSVTSATTASIGAAASTDADVRRSGETLTDAHRAMGQLEQTVTAIASASTEQSAALNAVAASVEEIAQHADAAKRATSDAGALELDALLSPAAERLRRWTIGTRVSSRAHGNNGSAQIRSTAGTDAPHTDAVMDESHADALAELAVAVDADQRAIVGDLIGVAVAVAYNGVAWRAIGTAHGALRGEIDQVRRTVGESTLAARSATDASASMRGVVTSLKDRYDEAMASLDGGLAAIADVEAAVADADQRVAAMTAAVERTNEIVSLIDTVSDDTVLLSLNAAIESSRAGDSGLGFGVIAAEIRQLASATQQVTASVSSIVAQIAAESEAVRTAIAGVAAGAAAVAEAALPVRSAVSTLRFAFDETLRCALDVSAAAELQVHGLERVAQNAARSAAALDAESTSGSQDRRLELYAIGDRAHRIAARRDVAVETAAVRRFVDDVAQRVEAVFDDVIQSGRVPAATFFDLRYDEIRGDKIGQLARLFDVSRVPQSGFDPPKYATPWDRLVDERIVAVLNEAFERAAFARPMVISVTDLNGFMYAYPSRLIKDWTGVEQHDRIGNRVKRILDDEHAIAMVRSGLGVAAASIPLRAPYAAFENAGCTLERAPGERAWMLSVYARDVNDVVNDFEMPIYVRGRRHGAIRFGYHVEVL